MLKWLLALAFVGMLYFMTEDRAGLWAWFTRSSDSASARGNRNPSPVKGIGDGATDLLQKMTGRSVWNEQNLNGLGLELPFGLQSQPIGSSRSNTHLESFNGKLGSRTIHVTYGKNSTLAGGVMLSWGDAMLNLGAQKLKMVPMSRNPSSTLIRGLRVQRSDYTTISGSPIIRARCALLEKGPQAWCLEFHSPEGDSEAERDFLRIVNSARPL